jgi:hypothetical protein
MQPKMHAGNNAYSDAYLFCGLLHPVFGDVGFHCLRPWGEAILATYKRCRRRPLRCRRRHLRRGRLHCLRCYRCLRCRCCRCDSSDDRRRAVCRMWQRRRAAAAESDATAATGT